MTTNALKWIVEKAKAIQKKHPGKKWPTCIKEASAEYRKKFTTGRKREAGKK